MADHVFARKVYGGYTSPSSVEPCRYEQYPYHDSITTRDGNPNPQKPSTIVICPWYLEKMKRTLWRDGNALTSIAGRIQTFQQFPDLRPMYEDKVLIDFYVFFDDVLVHEVVCSSREQYHH